MNFLDGGVKMKRLEQFTALVIILVYTPFPSLLKAEFLLSTPSGWELEFEQIAADRNFIVWSQQSENIYGYNLNNAENFLITSNASNIDYLAVNRKYVVWLNNYNVYGYNLVTSTEFPICTNPTGQDAPRISGNFVVWQDYRTTADYDIYAYNLDTSTEFPICLNSPGDQTEPVIDRHFVIWTDTRNGNNDIYGYDIAASTEFPICTNSADQTNPQISGNIVVWQDERNGNPDIYGYNLITHAEFPVCTDGSYQYDPKIGGNVVVWDDSRDDIYGYNLAVGSGFSVPVRGYKHYYYGVRNNNIVWGDGFDYSAAINFYNPQEGLLKRFYLPAPDCGESQYAEIASAGDFVLWQYRDEYCTATQQQIWGMHIGNSDEWLWPADVNKGIPYYGSTAGMTGMAAISCGYNDFKDVWHSFTPTMTGDYIVSLCGSSFDTTLAVFDANLETEIACNDDYCGYQSQVTLKAKAGKQYVIRVAGYDGDSGNYVLTISGPPECVNRPSADLNGDCKVDFIDIAVICSQWLDCGLDDPNACWQ
jgi:beta propeller repeat protein